MMSVRQTARVATLVGHHQRRFLSSKNTSPEISKTFLHAGKKDNFKKNWLSDPSTYPLIAVVGAAGALCGGVAVYFLTSNKDVQINPNKRKEIIRSWGN